VYLNKMSRATKGKGKAMFLQKSVESLSETGTPTSGGDNRASPTVTCAVERAVEAFIGNKDFITKISCEIIDKVSQRVIEGLTASLEAAHQQIDSLRSEVSSLRNQLQKKDEEIHERVDNLEQYQRRNNLRIFGIPETQGEDTDLLVVDLFKNKLKLDIDVSHIERSHRVGRERTVPEGGPQTRPRAIIVKMSSYRYRRLVYESKRRLKGTGVVVREDLTRRRTEMYNRAVDKHGFQRVWTTDGRICWIDKDGKRGTQN
jgi:hypothetical protein